jgi:hypothetical protein
LAGHRRARDENLRPGEDGNAIGLDIIVGEPQPSFRSLAVAVLAQPPRARRTALVVADMEAATQLLPVRLVPGRKLATRIARLKTDTRESGAASRHSSLGVRNSVRKVSDAPRLRPSEGKVLTYLIESGDYEELQTRIKQEAEQDRKDSIAASARGAAITRAADMCRLVEVAVATLDQRCEYSSSVVAAAREGVQQALRPGWLNTDGGAQLFMVSPEIWQRVRQRRHLHGQPTPPGRRAYE